MRGWPTPKTLKELRGFLGLTGYCRRFVRVYAQLAKVLTDQLRKDAFSWGPEADLAFKNLKEAMTTVPVLAMPNFQKLFVIETDASHHGLGAVLLQDRHPIAYYSKVLGQWASNKSIYEKELMAIIFVVLKWKHYVMGRRFIVRSDQKSIKKGL